MKEWNEDNEYHIGQIKIIKVVVIFIILALVLMAMFLLINKLNNKNLIQYDNSNIKNSSKYSLNKKIGEYEFKNNKEKIAYMDYMLKQIKPKELQRFCKINNDYLYTLLDLTEYADGNDVIEHMKYFGYENLFNYIFNNTVLEKDLPVTDGFAKKFNKELYDYFGFLVDKDKLSLNIYIDQIENRIKIDEGKIVNELKDENGKMLDWDIEVYNIYNMKYILDKEGKIEDIILDNVDKLLDKDGNKIIIKHSNKFDENYYIGYIAELSTGRNFYRNYFGATAEFDNTISMYCFTEKFLSENDLEFSILDKEFVNECSIKKYKDFFEYDFEDPLKNFVEFYKKGYIPVAINNREIKKHYNVYFTYTEDLYLDDVIVEFLYEEEI